MTEEVRWAPLREDERLLVEHRLASMVLENEAGKLKPTAKRALETQRDSADAALKKISGSPKKVGGIAKDGLQALEGLEILKIGRMDQMVNLCLSFTRRALTALAFFESYGTRGELAAHFMEKARAVGYTAANAITQVDQIIERQKEQRQ